MTALPLPLSLHLVLQQALSHHRSGRLPEAEQLYRAVLQAQPNQAEANHNLGVLAIQAEQYAVGLHHLKNALDALPSEEQHWRSYAEGLLASGEAKAAQTLLQKAVQHGFKSSAVQALRQKAKVAAQHKPVKGAAPSPNDMNLLLALFNAGRYEELEHRSRLLLKQYPESGFVWKTLGSAQGMQGKETLPTFQKAVELLPDDAEAHNNLSLSLKKLGRLDKALVSCRRALEINPDFAEAYSNWVEIAAQDFQHGKNGEHKRALSVSSGDQTPPGAPHAQNDAMISVIICSINDKKFAAVARMYGELLANTSFEIIRIGDAHSLCEGYNRGIRQSRGALLIFSHDDIKILSPDFNGKLRRHLADYDLIGVAGTTHLIKGSWGQAGWPHLHGWVAHRKQNEAEGTHFELSVFRVQSPVVENIQAVDGLFFAVRRDVAEHILFDETTFDGFHFYDLDFSYRAHLAGYKLAVCNDLLIAHDSTGNFNTEYIYYAERFSKKHNTTLSSTPSGKRGGAAVKFTTQKQIVDFCHFFLVMAATP